MGNREYFLLCKVEDILIAKNYEFQILNNIIKVYFNNGDEIEIERALYGTYPTAIAPLQAISAPISRIPMSLIMEYADGDWERFTDYQMYTLFPFGRIIRDVAQPGRGLIDNPSRLLEKFAAMPIHDISRFRGQQKDEIEAGTRYKQPKPGIF